MARIHFESDDDLPDLADLLKSSRPSPRKRIQRKPTSGVKQSATGADEPDPAIPISNTRKDENLSERYLGKSDREQPRRQRALKKLERNTRLLPAMKGSTQVPKTARKHNDSDCVLSNSTTRQKRDSAKEQNISREGEVEDKTGSHTISGDESYRGSDEDLPSPSKLWSKPRERIYPLHKKQQQQNPKEATLRPNSITLFQPPEQGSDDCTPFRRGNTNLNRPQSRPTSSSDNDRGALLVYEPPKRLSPHKKPPSSRPCTPPPRPFKQKLISPSKNKTARIPTPPLRPSIDAFWSQDVVNEWNDQYSPRKTVTSPRKNRFATPPMDAGSDEEPPSPSTSPRKSPVKRDKKAMEVKKAFELKKNSLAESFLKELDDRITDGKVAELAASGGGVKIIWSKKLNSTAGRANWRRECTRKRTTDGVEEKTYKHIANIELAEKVIDDEERLVNVLAHEFCHLANFMVSGVKDNPHGKEFKQWARKVSSTFSHRNVEVTTKHSYVIDYKYIWECVSCRQEFKRHSKSIDPAKHTCGTCKSKLVQTKPPARNVKTSEYQIFVKENFQRVRRENSGLSHGGIMEVLGRLYRESKVESVKEKNKAKETVDIEKIVSAIEVISLDD